jgi:TRAP-type mannitol/chloroaromatic compound transport system permease small subunit
MRLADSLDMISRMTAERVRWLALMMVLVQFAIVVGATCSAYNIIARAGERALHARDAVHAGAGYTLLVDKHVRVDVFYAKASPQTRAASISSAICLSADPVHAGDPLLVLAVGAEFLEDP